jgi:uncharacterized membrane protein YcaP (DUF421 family)
MEPQDFKFADAGRLFIGEVPAAFLSEVILRIFCLFLLLIFSMRLLGRRLSSTLNRNELATLVLISAAIGIPMQQPGNGLIPAFIIAFIVVFIIRKINTWSFRNKKIEKIMRGRISILVSDGVLDYKMMETAGVSQERIFSQVRSEGIDNLGKVQRLYMESGGSYSLLEKEGENPGLSVIPAWDTDYRNSQQYRNDMRSCRNCGHTVKTDEAFSNCTRCDSNTWETSVI